LEARISKRVAKGEAPEDVDREEAVLVSELGEEAELGKEAVLVSELAVRSEVELEGLQVSVEVGVGGGSSSMVSFDVESEGEGRTLLDGRAV